mgnify:CR=1 FL=1
MHMFVTWLYSYRKYVLKALMHRLVLDVVQHDHAIGLQQQISIKEVNQRIIECMPAVDVD